MGSFLPLFMRVRGWCVSHNFSYWPFLPEKPTKIETFLFGRHSFLSEDEQRIPNILEILFLRKKFQTQTHRANKILNFYLQSFAFVLLFVDSPFFSLNLNYIFYYYCLASCFFAKSKDKKCSLLNVFSSCHLILFRYYCLTVHIDMTLIGTVDDCMHYIIKRCSQNFIYYRLNGL